jgi:Domain of unknown function (DUF2760)
MMATGLRWAGVLAIGAVTAAGAVLALGGALAPAGGDLAALLTAAGGADPLVVGVVAGAPFLAAVVVGLLRGSGRPAAVPAASRQPAAVASGAPPRAGDEALALLMLLQQEGRFVDFVEEDLTPYSDAQVGSAVRSIHQGCRAALHERLELQSILPGEEGATVTVEAGFDPAAVRISGNVHGKPPYQGVLRHPGWRSSPVKLPERTGDRDVSILAPAEVEIP